MFKKQLLLASTTAAAIAVLGSYHYLHLVMFLGDRPE